MVFKSLSLLVFLIFANKSVYQKGNFFKKSFKSSNIFLQCQILTIITRIFSRKSLNYITFRMYQEFSYSSKFRSYLSQFGIRTVPISRSAFSHPGCVFIEEHRLSYSYNLVAARFGPFAPPLKQLKLKIFSV